MIESRPPTVFDPLHYLRLLEHKSRALEQAAPRASWKLPDCFQHLRQVLELRLKKHELRVWKTTARSSVRQFLIFPRSNLKRVLHKGASSRWLHARGCGNARR